MTRLFLVSAIDSISGVDTLWVLLGAMLVFWMQPGFALVEAGMTRSKNTANILMKNFCDFMCGSVLFWVVGFSLMFGTDHGFVGWDGLFFRSNGGNENLPVPAFFIFQTMFCATAFHDCERCDGGAHEVFELSDLFRAYLGDCVSRLGPLGLGRRMALGTGFPRLCRQYAGACLWRYAGPGGCHGLGATYRKV